MSLSDLIKVNIYGLAAIVLGYLGISMLLAEIGLHLGKAVIGGLLAAIALCFLVYIGQLVVGPTTGAPQKTKGE